MLKKQTIFLRKLQKTGLKCVLRAMERMLDQELVAWKDDPRRVPLLVRGGRQVGKTFAIKKFGKRYFEHCVTINFERERRFCPLFDDSLDPKTILRNL